MIFIAHYPMSPYASKDQGCHDGDCASDVWKDGCLGCMCFNQGDASWCDGTKSAYYDNYYKDNQKNPFSDSNQDNRKCVTKFLPREAPCQHDWQCASGLECSFRFGGDMCYHIPDVITP